MSITIENITEWENRFSELILEFSPTQKTPKSYGQGVFRFASSEVLSVILPERGWGLVKKTKNNVYLKPPNPHDTPPFEIITKMPSVELALEIAETSYSSGESWASTMGEWISGYRHKHESSMQNVTTGEISVSPPESIFYIGAPYFYLIKVVKQEDEEGNGEFVYTTDEFYCSVKTTNNTNNEFQADAKQPTDIDSGTLIEGKELSIQQTRYERNPEARQKCIEHYGSSCQVCSFNFESIFGMIGQGFIHVHHIIPVSKQGGNYEVDPIRDLIPLCPNCHAMIHKKDPPYSIKELKKIILENQ